LNELAQLGTADVIEQDGVPVLMIHSDAEGNRLKTKSARRIVPVHPELIRLGFLDHVEQMRAAGNTRLFTELKRDARGYHSEHFQKWFAPSPVYRARR
jgi:hypothetical protein